MLASLVRRPTALPSIPSRTPKLAGGFLFVNGAILGGLFVEGGSSVRQNTAATSGGAVHAGGGIFGGVRVAGVGSRLCNNSATTSNGGAVSAGPAMASLEVADGAAVTGNSAGGAGGVAWVQGDVSSVRAVNGSTVSGNTATLEGAWAWARVPYVRLVWPAALKPRAEPRAVLGRASGPQRPYRSGARGRCTLCPHPPVTHPAS